MKSKTLTAVALLLAAWVLQSHSQPKKYYVDATSGSDANSGLSPSAAWKSIDKVNASTFAPGDSILFKRGETFRGSLVPASGSASGYIAYSAYGSGPKPKLLGAYDRSSPSNWTNQGGNIWRTKYKPVNLIGSELLQNPDFSVDLSGWTIYNDPSTGASTIFSRTTTAGEYYTSPGGGRVICVNRGSAQWNSDIQLHAFTGPVKALRWFRFSFMAKATRGFSVRENAISLHQWGPPWASYSASVSPAYVISTQWTSYELYFQASSTASDGSITFLLGNLMPNGDTLYIDACSFKECDASPEPLNTDVGNIYFDNESSWGVLVRNRSDLNGQGKFMYDEDGDFLEMYCIANPGAFYSHVELALNQRVIDITSRSYVVCENLDLRYGSFGVEGSNTHHIWIKDCDVSFIGGGNITGEHPPGRGGNGLQFWKGNHDNIVERCTFNQCWDSGITAQGRDGTAGYEVFNIYFRNNVINNSEYSFEYWEGGTSTRAHDIYFENNTCLNAGNGWGHSQRPDPNGTHVMMWANPAQTADVHIRNNVFSNAVDQGVRWHRLEDVHKVMMDHNCWYQSSGLLAKIILSDTIGILNITYNYATQWDAYRADTKQDSNSIHSDPLLNSDFTLQAPSPCIDAGITLSTVTDDFNGTARPQGPAYDIGAFEASAWLVAPPTLLAPADNMKKVPINLTLSWTKLSRAQKYSLAVSLTPTFSSLVVTDTSLVDTIKAIGPLQYGTTYYWRVCAKNVGATSDWSQVRSFTTIAATPLGPAYYVSPTGSDLNPGTEALPWKTLGKAASSATAGVTVFIKQGIYNERLVPVNSGTSSAPITFTSYPGDSVTIDGTGMNLPSGRAHFWSGLVDIQTLKHIKISGLRVTNSEATGILVNRCSFITIEKNYTQSTYSPGITAVESDHVYVQGNEVVNGCIGGDQECISISWCDVFEVKNNRVHDGFTEGIDVKEGSSNGIVAKNEVFQQRNNRTGIYIDAFSKHEFNIDVFDNICHNDGHGIDVASENGGLIERINVYHNKVYNNDRGIWIPGWGIAQTHPIHNIAIYGNEIHNNRVGLEIGGYTGTNIDSIRIYNNIIYDDSATGVRITRYGDLTGNYLLRNIEIVNNTICGNGIARIGWDAENSGINIFQCNPENTLIRNNIFSGNAVSTICVQPEVPAASVTINYNFFDGFRNFPNEKAGTNALYGRPLFVDSLRHDFHLQATSPCIDQGHPDQKYNDPGDPARPVYALYPARGTLRNDMGAYGGPYAGYWDLSASIARPQTPLLSLPADSARSVSTTPMLTWSGVLGTDRYRLQLSTTSSFTSKVVDDSAVTDCYRQVGPLMNNTTYFWRVHATNVAGTSAWSQIRSFTTVVAAPTTPTLASPADSAKNIQLNTTLSWNAVQAATVYHLQVSTASSFTSTVVNDSLLTATSRSVGPLSLATTYYWRVRAGNDGGWGAHSAARQFSTIRTTSVEQLGSEIPKEFSLSQNFPNPFNPSTRIRFGVPKSCNVLVRIFDILGREVETLVAQELAPAYYQTIWNANVSSGVYFVRIQTPDFVNTKKMILLH